MRLHHFMLALLTVAATGTCAAQSYPMQENGKPVSGAPANAIIGLWHVNVSVKPCANPGAPANEFFALNTYQAGGTLSDANTFPPTSRGPGMGIWSYDPIGEAYHAHMQFARFVNGVFDGLQDVEDVSTLSPDKMTMHTIIHARMLNADGSLRVELCGTADGERVGF